MMKFKTAIGLMLVVLSLGLMSNSGGRATAGFGASGAPGQGTCGNAGCHAAGNFNPTVDIAVLDDNGNVIDEYFPDVTYKVSVTISAGMGTPAGYGFQMLALDAAENDMSVWSNPSANAQVVDLGSRNYVEQNATSSTNTFEVDWKASMAESDDVNFYVAANAVNGNGSPGQDGTATTTLTIPRAVLSTENLADKLNLIVSPNPVSDQLTVGLSATYTSIEIIDLMGKKMMQSTDSQIDVSMLARGTYIVKVNLDEGKIATRKIVKL